MSTTFSIQRAKQYIDTLFYKMAEPYLANNVLCDQVLSWFGDEESRTLYRDEITFKILSNLLGEDAAVNLSPAGMSKRQWGETYLETVARKDEWPALSFPESEQWPFCTYTMTYRLGQYQYKDLVDVCPGDVVLDCGAFILDSSIWAVQKGAARVYAFEPNPNSLPHMQANKAAHDPDDKICIIPSGIGETASTYAFNGDSGGSSMIVETGSMHIDVVPLDDFCQEHGIIPSYIKMDIEGFELPALKGAKNIIAQYTPKLAVCVYHKLEDLWTIPQYIKSVMPEYSFYLKKHAISSDLVLYATL